MAIWAAMVPFIKARLSLDEAHLGTLLLCVGVGRGGNFRRAAAEHFH